MAASPGPVVLTKRHIFGSSPHSQILVVDAHHILYQAGHCLVLFNTTKETQKFLNPNKGINNGSIVCATLSKNKRFLAIVEEKEIIIFSMETLRKRKTLPQESHPFEVTRFVSACFNAQGELITLSHYSETNTYHLTQWDWHECRPNVVTPLTNFIENQKIFSGFTSCLCTGEKTHTDVCVISPEGFKVFTLSEKHFIPFNNKFILDKYMEEFDSRPSWTASLWIGEDLILGTHSGDLLLFESHNFHSVIMTPQIKEEGMGNEINCMELITNDCLAVGLNNGCIKILTRASSSNSWELWGETSSYCPHQNPIQSMSISFQKDILYVMSKQKLLCVKLPNFEEPQKENELLEFSEPYSNFHIGDVTGLDTCIRKQLFATCGLDGTIRIWNYQEMLPELTKKYEGVELHSLAFHPSGFHLLVGFPDRLRLLNILLNDLRIQKEFNGIRGCKECQFANGGHLFACVVHNDKIQIVSTWNGQMVHNLRGHTQTVNSLCFTSTDEFLISAGSDGSVYQWNTATGDRIQEFSNRQHPVRAAIATLEDKLYTVGLKGNLREIADNQLERSFELQIGMTAVTDKYFFLTCHAHS